MAGINASAPADVSRPSPGRSGAAPVAKPPQLRARKRKETLVALVFIFPALVGFVAFFAWPTARGIYYSFTDYDLLTGPKWAGFGNYRQMWHDDVFWNSLKVTLEYVVINIGVQMVVALLLAVLIHRLTKSAILRGVILLPYLVSNVVVALLWYWMADYNLGIINHMLDWVGIDPIGFFGDESWAIPTVALVNVWRYMGYTALLIFAGLQMIRTDVYEAAAIDGASERRIFFNITLPLLRPILALVLVVNLIGSWQIFDTIAVTTKGAPVNGTRVIQYYIYEQAFNQLHFGYASAMALVLFVILAVIAIAQLKLLRADESDES